MHNKLLIISGPTASGKTALAIELARQFGGELVSADSRQVYQGMDIVTGKDVENSKFQISNTKLQKKIQEKIDTPVTVGSYDADGVQVWGLDFVKPNQPFDVSSYVVITREIIRDIQSRNKLPIVVGGTGFYIRGLLKPYQTVGVPINQQLRTRLETKTIIQLQNELQTIDPGKWQKMNNSDRNNPRRLVRAIEVGIWKQRNRKKIRQLEFEDQESDYNYLWVGLSADKKLLKQRITQRVHDRLNSGAKREVELLLQQGYSWDLPSMSAQGYRDWKDYIEGKETFDEMINDWIVHEVKNAKNQMTWFRKEADIHWFPITGQGYPANVKVLVQKWLKTR